MADHWFSQQLFSPYLRSGDEKRNLTLRQLSEEEGIGMNTSGTRLLNLYKKRLVLRVEGLVTGKEDLHRGKQFVYQPLLP
jgi:hypothetical protein